MDARNYKKKRTGLLSAFLLYLIAGIVVHVLGIPLDLLFLADGRPLFGTVLTHLLLLGVLVFALPFFQRSIKDLFVAKKETAVSGTSKIGVSLCYIGVFLLLQLVFPDHALATIPLSFVSQSLVTTGIACFTAALSCELLHRGLILPILETRFSSCVCFLLSGFFSALFSLSFTAFLPLWVLGITLSWIRQKTRSLSFAIFWHFCGNLFLVFLQILQESFLKTEGNRWFLIGKFLFLIFLSGGLFSIGFYCVTKRIKKKILFIVLMVCLLGFFLGTTLLCVFQPPNPIVALHLTKEGTIVSSENYNVTDFYISQSGEYVLWLDISGNDVLIDAVLCDQNGTVIKNLYGINREQKESLTLEQGNYRFFYGFELKENREFASCSLKIILYK